MRRKANPINEPAALNFAENLFAVWPDFRPTKALYLDLEGGGGGDGGSSPGQDAVAGASRTASSRTRPAAAAP